MPTFVALLRAINVGGTGKLLMTDLVKLCEKADFTDVRTYIQSGNVVFAAKGTEAKVQATLEKALAAKLGKPVGVFLRTAAQLATVLADNPFTAAPTNRVIVYFLADTPPKDALASVKTPGGEQLALHGREVYIHYPVGLGVSKLKVPFTSVGTGRNLNTIAKLAAMATTP
jgi:uncharacterized protein (DUF1697 family)